MKMSPRVSIPISSGELHVAQSSQFLLLVLYLPLEEGHRRRGGRTEAGRVRRGGGQVRVLRGRQRMAAGVNGASGIGVQISRGRRTSSHRHGVNGEPLFKQDVTDVLQHLNVAEHVLTVAAQRLGDTEQAVQDVVLCVLQGTQQNVIKRNEEAQE